MNGLNEVLFQGVYISPSQLLIAMAAFTMIFSVFTGMVIAFVKDKFDGDQD